MLHLSDLHMMPDQARKQRWVASLAGLDPDLVVVTGDNMAHPDAVPGGAARPAAAAGLPGRLRVRLQRLHRAGAEEPVHLLPARPRVHRGRRAAHRGAAQVFTGAGWADLNNARDHVKAGGGSVDLVGVDDPHIDRDDYPAVAGAASSVGRPAIALTHSPEPRVLDADGGGRLRAAAGRAHPRRSGLRAGLRGAGHQLRPRPADGARAAPLAAARTRWLHVSAGLGTHPTAPVRFACPPEATLLTLSPATCSAPAGPDGGGTEFGPAVPGSAILYRQPRGVAQLGSALRSGRRGRGFESRHPDQVRGHIRSMDVPSSVLLTMHRPAL